MRVPDGGAAILVFDSTGRDKPVFPARCGHRGCVGLSCPGRGAGGSGRLVDLQAVPFGIVLPDLRPDPFDGIGWRVQQFLRSEEHTSELQSLMRISYAVFGLK